MYIIIVVVINGVVIKFTRREIKTSLMTMCITYLLWRSCNFNVGNTRVGQ